MKIIKVIKIAGIGIGVLVISSVLFLYIFISIKYPEISDTFLNSNSQSSDLSQTDLSYAKIEVVDWTNRLSSSRSYVYVEGILKNTGNAVAERVKVTVRALDKNGKLIALEQGCYADNPTVYPERETTFQVMIENYPSIKKFSLSVDWD